MKIDECLTLLHNSLPPRCIVSPQNTPLGLIARSVVEMASAYNNDGNTFLASGDPVNALASAWYGFGWLHFGCSYGLLASSQNPACPFLEPCEMLPSTFHEQLEEKTSRYSRLLHTAQSSVVCAADPATVSYEFAQRILFITVIYARSGSNYRSAGSLEDALGCFSYGHGWLDAGVRAGLFRIVAERELFML